VGGRTVVFVHDGGVEVYDASGDRREGFLGGTTGALSADGSTYAFAPSVDELTQGTASGLVLHDTRTGDEARVALDEPAVDLAWYGGDAYVVTEGAGERSLWQCDVEGCGEVLTDPSGTLRLR
jgi:hypothetical protein